MNNENTERILDAQRHLEEMLKMINGFQKDSGNDFTPKYGVYYDDESYMLKKMREMNKRSRQKIRATQQVT